MTEEEPGAQAGRIGLSYLLLFSGYGLLLPFLPVFAHKAAQLSESRVGLVFATQRVLGCLATPAIGWLADRFRSHRLVLLASLGLSAGTQQLLLPAAAADPSSLRFGLVLGATGLTAVLSSSTPVLDSFAMRHTGSAGAYGRARLWGAVGFGVASLAGGSMLEWTGWPAVFGGFGALQLGACAAIYGMDMQAMAEAGGRPDPAESGGESEKPTAFGELGFFGLVTLGGGLSGVIDTFLFVRLEQLGAGALCMGAARLVMCAAEVPFFQVSGWVIARLGTYGTLALTGAAYAGRFGYYALLVEPWWVLPAEVLHGITFAALWSVAVSHAQEIAPAGKAAQYQGAVEALHWGLGYGLGALVGGLAFEAYGAVWTFWVAAAVAVGMVAWSLGLQLQQPRTGMSCEEVELGKDGSRYEMAVEDEEPGDQTPRETRSERQGGVEEQRGCEEDGASETEPLGPGVQAADTSEPP